MLVKVYRIELTIGRNNMKFIKANEAYKVILIGNEFRAINSHNRSAELSKSL